MYIPSRSTISDNSLLSFFHFSIFYYSGDPRFYKRMVEFRMHVSHMIFHFVFSGESRVAFILTFCGEKAEFSRSGTMFGCMTFEIGWAAVCLVADRAGVSGTGSCGGRFGGRLDGIGIYRRDDWYGAEGFRVSRSGYTVSNVRRSGNAEAMHVVHRPKKVVVVTVDVFSR